MRFLLTFAILSVLHCTMIAQTAADFTVTDSEGNAHSLYSDYLDQGDVVVLKFFFSTCPPCNASAPAVQQLYEDYGSGNAGMQMISLTTQPWDNNGNAANYVNQHGLTLPVSGADGGGYDASQPFRTGQYGPFFGTPSYAVIEPDGTVIYPVFFNSIRSTLDDLLGMAPQSTSVNLNMTNAKTGAPIDVNGLSVILKPANASGPTVDLMALTNGTLVFDYPSADLPEINNPIIVFSSNGSALSDEINSLDLVSMARHILSLTPITNPLQLQAADVNSSGTVTGADVVAIREVLLEKRNSFPNGTPSYIFIPSEVPLSTNPGGITSLSTQVLKVGDATID